MPFKISSYEPRDTMEWLKALHEDGKLEKYYEMLRVIARDAERAYTVCVSDAKLAAMQGLAETLARDIKSLKGDAS